VGWSWSKTKTYQVEISPFTNKLFNLRAILNSENVPNVPNNPNVPNVTNTTNTANATNNNSGIVNTNEKPEIG
jgi:hypothetical protein